MATNETDTKMPFTEHLEELRHRLIICFVAVGIGFVICYFFAKQIFEVLMRPLIQVMPPGIRPRLPGFPLSPFSGLPR